MNRGYSLWKHTAVLCAALSVLVGVHRSTALAGALPQTATDGSAHAPQPIPADEYERLCRAEEADLGRVRCGAADDSSINAALIVVGLVVLVFLVVVGRIEHDVQDVYKPPPPAEEGNGEVETS